MGSVSDEDMAAAMQAAIATRDAPLSPDLAPYVADGWINHPLVHMPLAGDGSTNALANVSLDMGRAMVASALARDDWERCVMHHRREWRFAGVALVADRVDDPTYWRLVGDAWSDTENPWAHADEWRALFAADRPGREAMMGEDDRAALAAMPGTLAIYRGATHAEARVGFSWTTSRDLADWYALTPRAFYGQSASAPCRVEGRVAKSEVIAYLHHGHRMESEVLALPEAVEVVEVVPVEPGA